MSAFAPSLERYGFALRAVDRSRVEGNQCTHGSLRPAPTWPRVRSLRVIETTASACALRHIFSGTARRVWRACCFPAASCSTPSAATIKLDRVDREARPVKRLLVLTSATGAGHDTHALATAAWCARIFGRFEDRRAGHGRPCAWKIRIAFYRGAVGFYNLIQRHAPWPSSRLL